MLIVVLSCMDYESRNTNPSPIYSIPYLFTTSLGQEKFVRGARWTPAAVRVMDEMIETHLVSLLEDANLAALHAGRTVVKAQDIHLSRRLRGERS